MSINWKTKLKQIERAIEYADHWETLLRYKKMLQIELEQVSPYGKQEYRNNKINKINELIEKIENKLNNPNFISVGFHGETGRNEDYELET